VARKGRLEEILSKARYSDDPSLYRVSYRDFDSIVEVSLPEFMTASENFSIIPASRIVTVKRKNEILFTKGASRQ
jgi:hypothetical protein